MAYVPNSTRYDGMTYRRCGDSGLLLPLISLGLWHNFGTQDDFETMRQMCFTAFDLGVTHFDLANNYGPLPGSAESNFGKILREDLSAYRDELVISTKAGYPMWPGPYGDHGSRKYLLASLDQSLKRLGLPYVDIFYHHRLDPDTPLEESMGALAQAVHSGKALYAGISRYDPVTFRRAVAILEDLHCPWVLHQVRYSMLDRSVETDGVLDATGEQGGGVIAFSPLAQGLLSEKYLHGIPSKSRAGKGAVSLQPNQITPERLEQICALNQLAKDRGQTLPQMALSWVLRDERVASVLIGASSPEQIRENAAIGKAPAFTADELVQIDRLTGAAFV